MKGHFLMQSIIVDVKMMHSEFFLMDLLTNFNNFIYQFRIRLFSQQVINHFLQYGPGYMKNDKGNYDCQYSINPPPVPAEEYPYQNDKGRNCIRTMMPAVCFNAVNICFPSQIKRILCQPFLGKQRNNSRRTCYRRS